MINAGDEADGDNVLRLLLLQAVFDVAMLKI